MSNQLEEKLKELNNRSSLKTLSPISAARSKEPSQLCKEEEKRSNENMLQFNKDDEQSKYMYSDQMAESLAKSH